MTITVNGELRQVNENCTVRDLLDELHLDLKTVVVQRNDDIVARNAFSDAILYEGDVIEVVRFVGGG